MAFKKRTKKRGRVRPKAVPGSPSVPEKTSPPVAEPLFRDPFRELERIRRQMDRLFEDWRPAAGRFPAFPALDEIPALDVYGEGDVVVVKAELPGMEKKDIEASIDGDLLTVRGEKKKEEDVHEGNYTYRERSYGSFSRSVRLPTEIDATKSKATFKNGVLMLRLPKTEEAKKRTHTVKVD
jgi:HSP20 family protein